MQVLDFQALAFCLVPGAGLLTLYSVIVDCLVNTLNINDI